MMKHLLLLAFCVSSLGAQVSLRGLAYDSLNGRVLSGAFIGIAGIKASAISDSMGRFVLQNVPLGAHRVIMQHEVLDALGLSSASAGVVVKDERDFVVVAVPAFTTLWRAFCGPMSLGADSGFVFGTVSRGGTVAPGAIVTAGWSRWPSDSIGRNLTGEKISSVADSAGRFALCGVPTAQQIGMQATLGNSQSQLALHPPLREGRIARRDLTITTVMAALLEVPRTVFKGRVLTDTSLRAIPGAVVHIADLGLTSTSDEYGNFQIGGVRTGLHSVQVRKLGFAFSEMRLDFGLDTVSRDLRMSSVRILDSIRVTASRYSPNDEAMRVFEENRKIGLGTFFTREYLEKNGDRRLGEILGQVRGTKVQTGSGGQAWLLPNRGTRSIGAGPTGASSDGGVPKQDDPSAPVNFISPNRNGCYPHVFVDGVDISPTEVPNINRYSPSQIEAIEYYAGPAQIPAEYNRLNKGYCGLVVIHTRRGKLP